MAEDDVHFPAPSDEDLQRVKATLRSTGGKHIVFNTNDVLNILKLEYQMRAEKMATDRIVLVSWVLAGATVVLAVATVALIFATLRTT